MIIGHPNLITDYLSNSNIFVSSGKYSFGIYLLHFLPIDVLDYLDDLGLYKFKSELVKAFWTVCLSYFIGYLFFCIIENPLIKFANYLCKKVETYMIPNKVSYFNQ